MAGCTSDLPLLVSYIQAFAVPMLSLAIAGAGWYVAWRQAGLAKKKFMFDEFYRQYEKRLSTFDQTRNFLRDATTGNLTEEKLTNFFFCAADAEFLFDKKVSDFLKNINSTATLLVQLRDKLKTLPDGAEKELQEAKKDICYDKIIAMGDGETSFVNVFRPYLQKKQW